MIAAVRVTINRKTGEVVSEEVTGSVEMTEDEYYQPLVQILGDRFLKKLSHNEDIKGV